MPGDHVAAEKRNTTASHQCLAILEPALAYDETLRNISGSPGSGVDAEIRWKRDRQPADSMGVGGRRGRGVGNARLDHIIKQERAYKLRMRYLPTSQYAITGGGAYFIECSHHKPRSML